MGTIEELEARLDVLTEDSYNAYLQDDAEGEAWIAAERKQVEAKLAETSKQS